MGIPLRVGASVLILASAVVASLALVGCKQPEVGFHFKETDNSMESFLPGFWKSKTGERFELTGDELFTVEYPVVMDPKHPKSSKYTIHAAGTYAVDGAKLTLTFTSLDPLTPWGESGDLEVRPTELRKAALKLVPLNVPHVGKMTWQDTNHVTVKMQADLTGPARTIELTRDARI